MQTTGISGNGIVTADSAEPKQLHTRAPLDATTSSGRSNGTELAEAPRIFKSPTTIATMRVPQIIETLENEARWVLDIAGQCPEGKKRKGSSNWELSDERQFLSVSPAHGQAESVFLEDYTNKRTQSATIRGNEFRSSKTSNEEGIKKEIAYEKKKDGQVQIEISGVEDLFYELKNTYKSREVKDTGSRGYIPGVADSPTLLASSAVNLMKFIRDKGLDKVPNIQFNICPKNLGPFATLSCTNQNGKIEYKLEGIKDLPRPKYAFKITMDKPDQLSIKLDGPISYPSLLVHKDGRYQSPPWLNQNPIQNTANIEYLKQFIQAHKPALLAGIEDEYRDKLEHNKKKINELATNDEAELQTWNHIETFEKMSIPKMVESLLAEAEAIKDYLANQKPADTLVYGRDSSESIVRKYARVNKNKNGEIVEFEITSSKQVPNPLAYEHRAQKHNYEPGYCMHYTYDEARDVTRIEKTQPDGKKLNLISNKGKVSLTYGESNSYSYGNSQPISTIVDRLLSHILWGGSISGDDIQIQAQSLIDVINRLKLPEAQSLGIEIDFPGSRLKYEDLIDSQIYSLTQRDTKLEVQQKFDSTTEVKLSLFGDVTYSKVIDAKGKVSDLEVKD